MLSRRRSYFLVPLFVAVCGLGIGLLTGNHVSAASPADDGSGVLAEGTGPSVTGAAG